ncbi:MAG TPA: hypothetical protein H9742_01260 [Candidatus Acetatifactor stercoripullorum]|uniref:Uncharacterized protein n=1 Tax=Candidatus Acetatifactor stercoripullorum TaxID=2838414 RepID=A0A9D1R1V4_9FIRM|nr:hypothetical protein [Candidatus Acetatifactor stercoripullorum]HIW80151.1 hypothetical protein [Candidatus Acetatifactor stercoripullorum]
MRRYEKEQGDQLVQVICNRCGKELRLENGYLKEGCLNVDYVFGYFSEKDGLRHRFDLCEECYDEMIRHFRIPVQISQERELL